MALLAAAVLISAADAQTLPAPNFSLRQNTRYWFNAWPADFNRDGRTDLIAGSNPALPWLTSPPDLIVGIGNGDGRFHAPVSLGISAQPLGTGHFNADAYIDVVILRATGEIAILPGNGNGTFGAPRDIGATTQQPFAAIADFNGDGQRDLAVGGVLAGGGAGMIIHPGNGDFTFGPPVELLTLDQDAVEAVAADLNGDGRTDLAVVTVCCSAFVFINQGGLLFQGTEIIQNSDLGDITAADLNRDGHLDLLIAASFVGGPTSDPGNVIVMLGNGDGTFQSRALYDTGVRGELTIVAGDFNRDGHLDVATGNWSPQQDDDFGTQLWDSISILVGDSTGRLFRGTTYALGTVNQGDADQVWVYTHNSLNTADLNGDGHRDLIASPGVFLLNMAAAANRAPTANAGPDILIVLGDDPDFWARGTGTDPDRHWLTYRWTNEAGQVLGTTPLFRGFPDRGTTQTYTLTVTDVHGASASDTMTVTSQGVATEWDSRDVGGVGAPGSASESSGVLTVLGAGSDIWGTADEFHFASQPVAYAAPGFEITARVTSVQNVNQWTKVGLMVRGGFGASASHASVFVTPTTVKGVAFQRRRSSGGSTTHTPGPAITAPVWLKLTVAGDGVRAFWRVGTGAWTLIAHDAGPFGFMSGGIRAGLAVSSHVDGTLARATFDNVSIRALPDLVGRDIGAVGVAGADRSNTAVYTVEGSGADIWGTADAFRFVAAGSIMAQAQVSARVRSVENTNAWAKAGVMIRETNLPGSRHVMVIVSAGRGVAMQWRSTTGGPSASTTPIAGTAPRWVRLTRQDSLFIGEVSSDGAMWQEVGRVTISMAGTIHGGLAVTSHNNSTLATAEFDDLVIEP